MEKNLELSALIHGKFRNESELAVKIGWSKQRLNKLVNGRKKPSLDDAIQLAEVLEQPLSIIADIFLRYKSPNGDNSRNKEEQ